MATNRVIHFKTGTAILDGSATPEEVYIFVSNIRAMRVGKGQSFFYIHLDSDHILEVKYNNKRARDMAVAAIRDYMSVEDKDLKKVDWFNGQYMSI